MTYNTKASSNTKEQPCYSVPAFFLVISLAPKINEVCHVDQNTNFDFVCITESWLKLLIQDSVVSLDGFNLVRRDRKKIMHGGVCTYIKDIILMR